jgi:hypothetical protein
MNTFEFLSCEDDSSSHSKEITKDIQEYYQFIQESKERMEKCWSEKYLSKNTIYLLFDILNDAYGYINYIKESFLYEDFYNAEEVLKMVDELDYFYKQMDKYRKFICSEDGFNAVNEIGDLLDIDFYYNMCIVNKNLDYLLTGLECSPDQLLNSVDIIYSKNDEINRKKRYQTYFQLLHQVFVKYPQRLTSDFKNNMYRICNGQDNLIKEFKEMIRKLDLKKN